MYLELWMAIQDAYAEIPCDLCQQTNLPVSHFLTINARQAELLGTPQGIFHAGCAHALITVFREVPITNSNGEHDRNDNQNR